MPTWSCSCVERGSSDTGPEERFADLDRLKGIFHREVLQISISCFIDVKIVDDAGRFNLGRGGTHGR